MRETLAQVRSQRETAIRWAVRLDGELADAAARSLADLAREAELRRAADLRAERAEADRDAALMRLSSRSAEAAAFRHQRDQAVAALADLLAAVDELTLSDVTHYEVATAIGLPALIARALLERYRRVTATIETS